MFNTTTTTTGGDGGGRHWRNDGFSSSRSLQRRFIGKPWALLAEWLFAANKADDDRLFAPKVVDDESQHQAPAVVSCATALPKDTQLIYGSCPAQDELLLSCCSECGTVVKCTALRHHMRVQHNVVLTGKTTTCSATTAGSTRRRLSHSRRKFSSSSSSSSDDRGKSRLSAAPSSSILSSKESPLAAVKSMSLTTSPHLSDPVSPSLAIVLDGLSTSRAPAFSESDSFAAPILDFGPGLTPASELPPVTAHEEVVSYEAPEPQMKPQKLSTGSRAVSRLTIKREIAFDSLSSSSSTSILPPSPPSLFSSAVVVDGPLAPAVATVEDRLVTITPPKTSSKPSRREPTSTTPKYVITHSSSDRLTIKLSKQSAILREASRQAPTSSPAPAPLPAPATSVVCDPSPVAAKPAKHSSSVRKKRKRRGSYCSLATAAAESCCSNVIVDGIKNTANANDLDQGFFIERLSPPPTPMSDESSAAASCLEHCLRPCTSSQILYSGTVDSSRRRRYHRDSFASAAAVAAPVPCADPTGSTNRNPRTVLNIVGRRVNSNIIIHTEREKSSRVREQLLLSRSRVVNGTLLPALEPSSKQCSDGSATTVLTLNPLIKSSPSSMKFFNSRGAAGVGTGAGGLENSGGENLKFPSPNGLRMSATSIDICASPTDMAPLPVVSCEDDSHFELDAVAEVVTATTTASGVDLGFGYRNSSSSSSSLAADSYSVISPNYRMSPGGGFASRAARDHHCRRPPVYNKQFHPQRLQNDFQKRGHFSASIAPCIGNNGYAAYGYGRGQCRPLKRIRSHVHGASGGGFGRGFGRMHRNNVQPSLYGFYGNCSSTSGVHPGMMPTTSSAPATYPQNMAATAAATRRGSKLLSQLTTSPAVIAPAPAAATTHVIAVSGTGVLPEGTKLVAVPASRANGLAPLLTAGIEGLQKTGGAAASAAVSIPGSSLIMSVKNRLSPQHAGKPVLSSLQKSGTFFIQSTKLISDGSRAPRVLVCPTGTGCAVSVGTNRATAPAQQIFVSVNAPRLSPKVSPVNQSIRNSQNMKPFSVQSQPTSMQCIRLTTSATTSPHTATNSATLLCTPVMFRNASAVVPQLDGKFVPSSLAGGAGSGPCTSSYPSGQRLADLNCTSPLVPPPAAHR